MLIDFCVQLLLKRTVRYFEGPPYLIREFKGIAGTQQFWCLAFVDACGVDESVQALCVTRTPSWQAHSSVGQRRKSVDLWEQQQTQTIGA